MKKKNEKEKPKLKNGVMKKTLILKDSITKNVDGWRWNQRMKSVVSFRSISGATTKAMKHHVMGYLEDESPDKSSRPDVFCEKGVLRNFAKFTGKHLCESLFFNKVTAKFLRTPFFTEHLWWLLLH